MGHNVLRKQDKASVWDYSLWSDGFYRRVVSGTGGRGDAGLSGVPDEPRLDQPIVGTSTEYGVHTCTKYRTEYSVQ